METTGRMEQQNSNDDLKRQSQADSHNENETNSSENNLLKTLLSTSTSSIISPTSVDNASSIAGTKTFKDSMITKEVNDTQLNLKKILYEPDKEAKEKEAIAPVVQNSNSVNIESQHDDDDHLSLEDRLVIDISDDERDVKKVEQSRRKFPSRSEKIQPIHLRINQANFPSSIIYNLQSTAKGIDNKVKIDILSSANNNQGDGISNTSCLANHSASTATKHRNISLTDEVNLIGYEIDKHMNKKTHEILNLIKELLENASMNATQFHAKMNEVGNVSVADLASIARKMIKRHKFESNPNQRDFMKIKHLNFPTGAKDLVNYFQSMLPSLTREKFITMIKFYEIIIKEMFNLNKTKILQYLIDFMIQRKNSNLDMLSFNYNVSNSPTFSHNISSSMAQAADSTQSPMGYRSFGYYDTGYNLIVRSDPIYLNASSTFKTNHRSVITCRTTPSVQLGNFEKRPFDENILEGRRNARRYVSINEEKRKVSENFNQIKNSAACDVKSSTTIKNHLVVPPSKKPIIRNSSPIIVESDTPPPSEMSSPPAHKIEKAKIISQQILQRAFSERVYPAVEPAKLYTKKIEFPKITHGHTTEPQVSKTIEITAINGNNDALMRGNISMHELKTLSQNGTEIIPTIRNKIVTRRKTIDIDRAMNNSNNNNNKTMEIKNVTAVKPSIQDQFIVSSTKPSSKPPPPRRQSCHERILANPDTTDNIGRNYMKFRYNYENQGHQGVQLKRNFANLQINEGKVSTQSQDSSHGQPKRVRFSNDNIIVSQNSCQRTYAQYSPQQHARSQHQHQMHAIDSLMMKTNTANIDYQKYEMNFNRALRARTYVDQIECINDINDRKAQQKVQYTSQSPQEYLQHNNSKPIRPIPEKITRIHRPVAISNEKAMMAAYHQLQSMHRDTSSLSVQQYAEHLKYVHQMKQAHLSAFSVPQQMPLHPQHSKTLPVGHVPPLQQHMQKVSETESDTDSLQRKLKAKAKSSKFYIEPVTKSFYNPPFSTYYTSPYVTTREKKTIPNTWDQQQQQWAYTHNINQLSRQQQAHFPHSSKQF